MPIIINLDIMMVKRKVRSRELAEVIGITEQNLSILKTGKAKAIRVKTLEIICRYLQCQPGDIFEFVDETSNLNLEILELIHGNTSNTIAKKLIISNRTIEHYIENLKFKFKARSKKELIEKCFPR